MIQGNNCRGKFPNSFSCIQSIRILEVLFRGLNTRTLPTSFLTWIQMDSLILFDATQPSNFDLALCIILLRSQPASLSTTEYIHLLRSLTIVRPQTGQEHDHDNSHDCRTGTNQHRRLDASRRWNIVDTYLSIIFMKDSCWYELEILIAAW